MTSTSYYNLIYYNGAKVRICLLVPYAKTSYGPYGKLNQLRNEFITLLRSEKIDRLT